MSDFSDTDTDSSVDNDFDNDKFPIQQFLNGYTCYDLMPDSGKVVVADGDLSFLDGVYILGENDITSSPLWDSKNSSIIGMLNISNIIATLIKMYDETIENNKDFNTEIIDWSTLLRNQSLRNQCRLTPILSPNDSLYSALSLLRENNVNRIPILSDQGDPLHIISYRRIIRFLVLKYRKHTPVLDLTLSEIEEMGTCITEVDSVSTEMKWLELLKKFAQLDVSAFLVKDSEGTVVDAVSRTDVLQFLYRSWGEEIPMEITVEEVLLLREATSEKLTVFDQSITLMQVLSRLAKSKIHRFLISKEVDSEQVFTKLVSLSDLLKVLAKY
eukprot:TRINITY_DN7019_c0_g1_i1.p1 TRINITY_DN7019_c0_g1~~TRINITY_DN7019_c0_g1_i1.p1  ORF type:complete len:328 (+),score=74.04 TRINITY_DN7019_c0_g1_i1:37-1020(+)